MALITIDQAKTHLRLSPDGSPSEFDEDIQMKIEQAEAIILDYLGDYVAAGFAAAVWTLNTVPPQVQAAMLIQFGELWKDRGDHDAGRLVRDDLSRQPDGYLSPEVTRLLHRLRDPALA